MVRCRQPEVTKDWVWWLWKTVQGTIRLTQKGRSWLSRIRWSGMCCREGLAAAPTTHPILLPALLHAPVCRSHASSSKGFSQKSSSHSMGMYLHNICSLYCAQQLPTFCFPASFHPHFTYLVFCPSSNTAAHFEQGGTKFQVAALQWEF